MSKIFYSDVERIIRRLIRKWDREFHLTPFKINCGNCETFAQEIADEVNRLGKNEGGGIWGEDNPELFQDGVDPDGHCFYMFSMPFLRNRYFDSECPKGVENPSFLPFYRRQRKIAQFH